MTFFGCCRISFFILHILIPLRKSNNHEVIIMSRKKRKIPVTPPENSELEYTLPSASMSDMTGLIPSSADDSAKRDAYDDIIPYIPRSAKNKTS